jgi:hypothetical protein
MSATPSALERIDACVVSETYPHVGEINPYAMHGTIVHEFLRACNAIGREAALLEAPIEHVEALEQIDLDALPVDPKSYAAEVAFAYNVETGEGRELGRALSREAAKAKCRPGEMPGVADVVGLTSNGGVVLPDYKTGWGHVSPAEVNWQVKTYALMAARAYGAEHASVQIIRVLDNGRIWSSKLEMDALDLEDHALELRKLMSRRARVLQLAAEGRRDELPNAVLGVHCRYCPAFRFCPAQLMALVGLRSPIVGESGEMTSEKVAEAWVALEQVERQLKTRKATLEQFALQTPVALPSGKILGRCKSTKETLLADRAQPILESLYGQELGLAVARDSIDLSPSMTKSSLKRALRRHVLPTLPRDEAKITLVNDSVLKAFRDRQAVTLLTKWSVRPHHPETEDAGDEDASGNADEMQLAAH